MPLTDLALIAGLRAGGADAEHFSADIRVDDDARGLVDRTVARFGSLDVAVNAAGARQLRGALTEQTVEAYAETFDTTVLGTMAWSCRRRATVSGPAFQAWRTRPDACASLDPATTSNISSTPGESTSLS